MGKEIKSKARELWMSNCQSVVSHTAYCCQDCVKMAHYFVPILLLQHAFRASSNNLPGVWYNLCFNCGQRTCCPFSMKQQVACLLIPSALNNVKKHDEFFERAKHRNTTIVRTICQNASIYIRTHVRARADAPTPTHSSGEQWWICLLCR